MVLVWVGTFVNKHLPFHMVAKPTLICDFHTLFLGGFLIAIKCAVTKLRVILLVACRVIISTTAHRWTFQGQVYWQQTALCQLSNF